MSEYNEYIYKRIREPWGWSVENTGVQIVRCRDCFYFRDGVCAQGDNGSGFVTLVNPDGDGFCAWGERMEK